MDVSDDKVLSLEEELELAEAYAESGPNDVPEKYMERCLEHAEKLAKQEGKDISERIKNIRKRWQSH